MAFNDAKKAFAKKALGVAMAATIPLTAYNYYDNHIDNNIEKTDTDSAVTKTMINSSSINENQIVEQTTNDYAAKIAKDIMIYKDVEGKYDNLERSSDPNKDSISIGKFGWEDALPYKDTPINNQASEVIKKIPSIANYAYIPYSQLTEEDKQNIKTGLDSDIGRKVQNEIILDQMNNFVQKEFSYISVGKDNRYYITNPKVKAYLASLASTGPEAVNVTMREFIADIGAENINDYEKVARYFYGDSRFIEDIPESEIDTYNKGAFSKRIENKYKHGYHKRALVSYNYINENWGTQAPSEEASAPSHTVKENIPLKEESGIFDKIKKLFGNEISSVNTRTLGKIAGGTITGLGFMALDPSTAHAAIPGLDQAAQTASSAIEHFGAIANNIPLLNNLKIDRSALKSFAKQAGKTALGLTLLTSPLIMQIHPIDLFNNIADSSNTKTEDSFQRSFHEYKPGDQLHLHSLNTVKNGKPVSHLTDSMGSTSFMGSQVYDPGTGGYRQTVQFGGRPPNGAERLAYDTANIHEYWQGVVDNWSWDMNAPKNTYEHRKKQEIQRFYKNPPYWKIVADKAAAIRDFSPFSLLPSFENNIAESAFMLPEKAIGNFLKAGSTSAKYGVNALGWTAVIGGLGYRRYRRKRGEKDYGNTGPEFEDIEITEPVEPIQTIEENVNHHSDEVSKSVNNTYTDDVIEKAIGNPETKYKYQYDSPIDLSKEDFINNKLNEALDGYSISTDALESAVKSELANAESERNRYLNNLAVKNVDSTANEHTRAHEEQELANAMADGRANIKNSYKENNGIPFKNTDEIHAPFTDEEVREAEEAVAKEKKTPAAETIPETEEKTDDYIESLEDASQEGSNAEDQQKEETIKEKSFEEMSKDELEKEINQLWGRTYDLWLKHDECLRNGNTQEANSIMDEISELISKRMPIVDIRDKKYPLISDSYDVYPPLDDIDHDLSKEEDTKDTIIEAEETENDIIKEEEKEEDAIVEENQVDDTVPEEEIAADNDTPEENIEEQKEKTKKQQKKEKKGEKGRKKKKTKKEKAAERKQKEIEQKIQNATSPPETTEDVSSEPSNLGQSESETKRETKINKSKPMGWKGKAAAFGGVLMAANIAYSMMAGGNSQRDMQHQESPSFFGQSSW